MKTNGEPYPDYRLRLARELLGATKLWNQCSICGDWVDRVACAEADPRDTYCPRCAQEMVRAEGRLHGIDRHQLADIGIDECECGNFMIDTSGPLWLSSLDVAADIRERQLCHRCTDCCEAVDCSCWEDESCDADHAEA